MLFSAYLERDLRKVPMQETLLFILIILSFSVQSAFGFGGALILIPVLSITTPVAVITPVLAMVGLLQSLEAAWNSKQAIRKDLLWRLLLCIAVTAPVGIIFVTMVDESIIKSILGIVIVVTGMTMLRKNIFQGTRKNASPYIFGSIAGVLGGAYNTMGPPMVIFFQLRGLDPDAYRATLHSFTVFSNIVILLLYWQLDRFVKDSFGLLFYLFIPLLIGTLIGKIIFARTKNRQYDSIICYMLIILGVFMFFASSKSWILEIIKMIVA